MAAEPALHPPLAGAGRRPGWRFLVAHPAHLIALGFGSGLSPGRPGPLGTLWAWLVYAVAAPLLGDGARGAVIAAGDAARLVGLHGDRAPSRPGRPVGDRLGRGGRLLARSSGW